jgi:aryl-alcohol dehydrogenase-like predicted oxidoreductase
MNYRRMGNTDLSLSEIGFGCGGNAGLMIRGGFSDQCRIVARAVELGVNYFDTSPDYGDGVAEENFGRVLRALTLRPLINSKVEIRQENLDDIAGHVVRSVEGSLGRLGIDCLDVVQIHNGPSRARPDMAGRSYAQLWIEDFLRPGGAVDGLRRLVRDGKVRYAGLVCRGNDGSEVRRLFDTASFHLINVPYTLLNPTAGGPAPTGLKVEPNFDGVLNDVSKRGIGAAVHSPLAGGFLTDASVLGAERHPLARPIDPATAASRRNRERAAKLHFLATENGISLAQAAYRFVLSHPGVSTVLGGFSAISQLEELATMSGSGPFAPDLAARLQTLWRSNFDAPSSSGALP